jgi:hypothetical protein
MAKVAAHNTKYIRMSLLIFFITAFKENNDAKNKGID